MVPQFARQLECGDAVITLIAWMQGWRFRVPYPVTDAALRAATEEADERARLAIDFTSLHVSLGRLSVVVDPGRATPELRARAGDAVFTPGVLAALGQLGIPRTEVTHVIISHRHDDHLSGVVLDEAGTTLSYPRARHVMSRLEWEALELDRGRAGRVRRLLETAGLVELVEGDHQIAPELTLLHTAGETPGYLSLRVSSAGRAFYWLGDLLHHHLEFAHPSWGPAGADPVALEGSRRRLWEVAAREGALVAWAHAAFPGWGRVERRRGGYGWVPLEG